MNEFREQIEALKDPDAIGAVRVEGFVSQEELDLVNAELADPERVAWYDAHDVYSNKRGLTIEQNHFTYALDLANGSHEPLEKIPQIVALYERTILLLQGLSNEFPALERWRPNELSFHRYDDAEVGLSRHRDNLRFTGMVAILSIDGICEFHAYHPDDEGDVDSYVASPGDLFLLRAPGLIEADKDVRPDHAVGALQTPTRTSMMIRHNQRPGAPLHGFHYANVD